VSPSNPPCPTNLFPTYVDTLEANWQKEIFERRNKWQTPIYMSRSPILNTYIHKHLTFAKSDFEKDRIEKVIVVVKDGLHLVERYCFLVEPFNANTQGMSAAQMSLRNIVGRLGIVCAGMKQLVDPSFHLMFSLRTESVSSSQVAKANTDPYFLPVNPREQDIDKGIVASIKSFPDSAIQLELIVERVT
jgi:hypothetical protein